MVQITDPVTGAYTRGDLDEALLQQIQRASQEGEPYCLCIIDVDYLKSINDAYGHKRGDEALRAVATRVQSVSRDDDRLFRYGGDEFVLLVQAAPLDASMAVAERAVRAVAATPVPGSPEVYASVSVGVARFPGDAESPDEVFALADARALSAKRRGRGRVVGPDTGDSAS